ncbi:MULTISPECIES: GntR family transcriptional regulator [Streptomyces]|uniref:GntR family transcriptional regulator n=4 Tax=Streptomyces TaxID=1883 RepID=A0A380P9A3_STRGR|nr:MULTISPECIES: GntR family transcriptional regulator [Streptomyces]NEC14009.1 GntR family transcriptional regulator [Streptomyces sp. SID8014]NEE24414.1 GntR family transcriptional regulator [Streptomyces sp. SID7982]NEE44034.1 GntR family transcriptional regulator [Streptomyces sp. SID8455]WSU34336.1 GntR family transcriptional regulator [Streptomyces gougerotii]MBL3808423.1 GntR family transcriptional regulator [Streptomyces sp. BRB081]
MTGDKPGLPDIKRDVPTAIHVQISEHIRLRIASGAWPAHYRLKSEPELAQEYGVSRGTLRRALTTLIEEGLLRQVRGRGTFVTSTTIEPAIAQKLSTLSEDFASQGVVTTTTVGECTLIAPPRPVAALLDVTPDTRVLRLTRVRRTDQGPVALLSNFVRTDLAPGIEKTDFTTASLFGVLEDTYGLKIATARRTFSAEAATTDVATELDLGQGDPVQYLQQVTYLDDGRPVEYSDVWIHSGRLRVTSLLLRR